MTGPSTHGRLKSAYAARFGPEPEPEPQGRTRRDALWDRLANVALFMLSFTGWLWLIGAPITWGWNKLFH